MGTICYGVAGEGRGHASRALTLIEHLRGRHKVVVFTFGQAWDMLAPVYEGTEVELRRISGLQFVYGALGRVSPTLTLLRSARVVAGWPREIAGMVRSLQELKPTLVISDFEPLTLRAATRADIAVVSLDHQRMLQACDLRGLPWGLRVAGKIMGGIARLLYGEPEHMLVSGFHLPPTRPGYEKAVRTGVLIRPQLLAAAPTNSGFLLGYLRRGSSERVLEALASSPLPVRLYGLGERPPTGSVSYHAVNNDVFVRDLAGCEAVVTTCGNQLIGEAFHLGKPVLGFPEPGNLEQHINAHLLQRSGGGVALGASELSPERLRQFLSQLAQYRWQIAKLEPCGNQQVLQWVDSWARSSGPSRSANSRGGAAWNATVPR